MERVVCFIDGLNLYHAIDELNGPDGNEKFHYLKWLDLKKVTERFILSNTEELVGIYNFTAYATHLPGPYKRHRTYIKALEAVGVTTIFGNFKDRTVWAKCCNSSSQKIYRKTKEEKETDVNMALYILNKAHQNEYDRAIIITRDSDITPAVRMVSELFPEKKFSTVSPPCAGHSYEMLQLCDRKHKLKVSTLEGCLLPDIIKSENGSIVARVPSKYKKENSA